MESVLASDDIWRTATYVALVVGVLAYLIGGLVSRVAGTWRQADGTVIRLRQAGPWVWGESRPPGGLQAYRGQAVFGRVRLARRDSGEGHLRALGFSPEQAGLVSGHQTGILKLRQTARDLMVGDFVGFAFSFENDKIRGSRPAEPVPRRLSRIG